MSKQIEALKLALEALEYIHEGANNQGPHTGISWRCVSNKAEPAITAIREALADSALERMAENARELGLDYEPPCKTGSQCTNKCQQCEQPTQQQEPKPKFVRNVDGVPCITLVEHEHLMRSRSQPAQPSKPHGFAGVTAWIGDATVTRIVTQVQIQHERVAGQSMTQAAQVCLDMLAAHGITGEKNGTR